MRSSDGDTSVGDIIALIRNESALRASVTEVVDLFNSDRTARDTAAISTAASVSDRFSALEASVSAIQDNLQTLATVQGEIQHLSNQLATNTSYRSIPECSPIAAPSNGRVVMVGDHGANVPASVTVHFECSPGYYVIGRNASTCQSSGTWSDVTPTCSACPSNCDCSSANTCPSCVPGFLFRSASDRTCVSINQLGRVQQHPAPSCLDLKQRIPNLPSGWYWLVDPNTNSAARFECDMTSYDGGWTLVARGIGGTVGCWESGNTTCGSPPSTFKFSDNTINGFTTSAIRYEGNGTIFQSNFFWRGGSQFCTYKHREPAAYFCNTAYQSPTFLDYGNTNSLVQGGHLGVGDWGNGYGCMHSSQSNDIGGGWYIRANGFVGCQRYCNARRQGCDINLWVR